jgi:nucleotide-binding universal stress UspA family protein
MCSHGDTGFKRWVIGSVAHHVIHHSPVPVLLLQESQRNPLVPEPARPLCALVALDGSPLAETALLPAAYLVAALAGPAGGALHLTQVVQMPVDARQEEVLHELGPEGLEPIGAYLVAVSKRVQDAGKDLKLSLRRSITLDTDIAHALLRIAEDGREDEAIEAWSGCDLIALSSHGREGFERWVMGSVTERILNATKLPLLIVRPMRTGQAKAKDSWKL